MTSDTPHTISASYVFESSHLAQLQHIADTDEFLHDDDQQALASSSTSSPASAQPEARGYDWSVLKDAIKYRIKQCLEDDFGMERPVELHPAAAATAQASALSSGEEETIQETEEVSSSLQSAPADASSEAEPVATSESDSSSVSAPHLNGTLMAAETSSVSPADAQNFYPTKRPASTLASTYAPLSAETIASHSSLLFSMLDDFDTQPPFTIQRLCELVTSPTLHYRSGDKWVSAIKRCLSVTATRDAFPISPVQAPVGLNGTHADEENGQDVVSEIEMDRMDGLPPSSASIPAGGRSRSSSVSSEPLFSPIPFIIRDEDGNLQVQSGSAALEEAQKDGQGAMSEPIPDLELGGADRTATATTDVLPKEVIDVAPAAAVAEDNKARESSASEVDGDDVQMAEADREESAAPATATTAEASGSVAAAVEATNPTSVEAPTVTHAASAAPPTEPLGVPEGAVDELDNPSHTVNALSSTTTSSTEDTAAPPAADKADIAQENDTEEDDENGRSSKRRKSVASIHDSRE